jgi:predicted transposase YdaD
MTLIRLSHDKLFRGSLDVPQVSRELLETYLPEAIRTIIDLDTIVDTQKSFIEEDLKESITDVLFKAKIKKECINPIHSSSRGRKKIEAPEEAISQEGAKESLELGGDEIFIYVIIEHQSTPERFMALRIHKYIINIWKDVQKNHPFTDTLPIVYPIVFYTGDRGYNYPTTLWELSDYPEIAKNIFIKGFGLTNLQKIPDEIILKKKWTGLLELFMKHIKTDNMLELWRTAVQLFPAVLSNPNGRSYILQFFHYCLTRFSEDDMIEVTSIIKEAIGKEEEVLMKSYAQTLYEKGWQAAKQEFEKEVRQEVIELVRQEVKQESLQEAKKEVEKEVRQEVEKKVRQEAKQEGEKATKFHIVKNMLINKIDISTIIKITGMLESEIMLIKNNLEL